MLESPAYKRGIRLLSTDFAAGRVSSDSAVHVAGRKRRHRAKRPLARLGEARGKRPGRGYDYWEKGSRISQNAKYGFLLIMS